MNLKQQILKIFFNPKRLKKIILKAGKQSTEDMNKIISEYKKIK